MKFEIAPKSTQVKANWYDARVYCFSLNIDGKIGWRLPTKDELNEIFQSENDFAWWYHWSSTESDGDNAWGQGFGSGSQSYTSKDHGSVYVRAIRDLT